MRQEGIAQQDEAKRHPVSRWQRHKAQGPAEPVEWENDADRSNDEAGCNDRHTGPALQERHLGRADDVDDERLGQQALHEPTGLEQCGFVPSLEDGEHHEERDVSAGCTLLRLRDRRQEHPERHLRGFTGILQADAYSGYNALWDPSRAQGAITPALCWSHARRQFFELADIVANARRGRKATAISPVALEAVKRIDALFDIERVINGVSVEERLRVRQERSRPLVGALETWLREERSRLSRAASVAKPIDYLLRRWDRFTPFLDDGRICLTTRRRAGAARLCSGTKIMALRRFRTRR
jgi:hypothetical protein